jgi:hypothetical protein
MFPVSGSCDKVCATLYSFIYCYFHSLLLPRLTVNFKYLLFYLFISFSQFYHCTDGQHTLIACPPGVIFEPLVGACVHADQTNRPNCSASRKLMLNTFRCEKSSFGFKLNYHISLNILGLLSQKSSILYVQILDLGPIQLFFVLVITIDLLIQRNNPFWNFFFFILSNRLFHFICCLAVRVAISTCAF